MSKNITSRKFKLQQDDQGLFFRSMGKKWRPPTDYIQNTFKIDGVEPHVYERLEVGSTIYAHSSLDDMAVWHLLDNNPQFGNFQIWREKVMSTYQGLDPLIKQLVNPETVLADESTENNVESIFKAF